MLVKNRKHGEHTSTRKFGLETAYKQHQNALKLSQTAGQTMRPRLVFQVHAHCAARIVRNYSPDQLQKKAVDPYESNPDQLIAHPQSYKILAQNLFMLVVKSRMYRNHRID